MGPYLSTPKKEKESMDGENAKVIIISTLYHLNFQTIAYVWCYRNARMEKHYGRYSYCGTRFRLRDIILWGL